jgi:DNA-binding beta-propeller fold protein YncE
MLRHFGRSSLATTIVLSLSAVAASIACGSSDPSASPDGSTGPEADGSTLEGSPGSDASSAPDATASCPRAAAPAERPRKVVVSHPFGATAGVKAKDFEVLDLSTAGTLTRPSTPVTFAMGTALSKPIVFTPDGEIGLVAQDDGSVGIFRLPASGPPVVIEAAYKSGFYAGSTVLSADGTRFWITDQNTAPNGGGVYEVTLGCDGKPGAAHLVVPGGGATAMALLPGAPTTAVLAARKAFDSAASKDVHVVDLAGRSLVASAAPFGDQDAIPSSVAITQDGKYALVADDGVIVGNRVAVVALGAQLAPVSLLSTPYPAMVVMSPFGNAAIVLNDDSTDQIHILKYDAANTSAPFSITGELVYKFGKPQIPVTASWIERGSLKGTVFIGENVAVRQIRFGAAGDVTDIAKLASGPGNEGIIGVVGVQP